MEYKQTWKDRLKARIYALRHAFRRRTNPVKKIKLKNLVLYVSRYKPLDLELCELKMDGCTCVLNIFPKARDLGFRGVDYSVDNIQTIRGVPLFYGEKCAFYGVLYLISKGVKPIKAVRLMKNFVSFTLSEEEAQMIILLNNVKGITKNLEQDNGEHCEGD